MPKYNTLFKFTPAGMSAYWNFFIAPKGTPNIDPTASGVAVPIPKTKAFRIRTFKTAKEMASEILNAFGSADPHKLLQCNELWGWLTFVLRNQILWDSVQHEWKVGESHRWYPSHPNNWRKGQRHLLRMPTFLLLHLGDDADHLLCNKPRTLPDIREQLTSQNDMAAEKFQSVARTLYFDDKTGKLKPGAGGKGPGSPRRLARIRRQLDVTWEIEDLDKSTILEKLPQEFDRFKPKP